MTEPEWEACADALEMLECLWRQLHFNRARHGRRKLRLFACACVRLNLLDLEKDHPGHMMTQAAERYADDLMNAQSLTKAEGAYYEWVTTVGDHREGARAAMVLGYPNALFAARGAAGYRGRRGQGERWLWSGSLQPQPQHADLLRHIVGNPFQSRPAPQCLANERTLAAALYAGEACAFALHDALLDAGRPELAEHFQGADDWHPKGCWAVDLVLGKK